MKELDSYITRMQAQFDELWEKENAIYVQHLVNSKNILEVGCNNGTLARELGTQLSFDSYTGIDIESYFIELAAAACNDKRITFRAASADRIPGIAYDAVILRFVFQHLPNAENTLTNLLAKLPEGGVVIVEDADTASPPLLYPEQPTVHNLWLQLVKARNEHSANNSISSIPHLLNKNGLRLAGMFSVPTLSQLSEDLDSTVAPLYSISPDLQEILTGIDPMSYVIKTSFIFVGKKVIPAIVLNPDVTYRAIDGEITFMHAGKGRFYTLNKSGSMIFRTLLDRLDMEESITVISRVYNVDPERIRTDITELIAALKSNGIVI